MDTTQRAERTTTHCNDSRFMDDVAVIPVHLPLHTTILMERFLARACVHDLWVSVKVGKWGESRNDG